jgi:hypothetical protein
MEKRLYPVIIVEIYATRKALRTWMIAMLLGAQIASRAILAYVQAARNE